MSDFDLFVLVEGRSHDRPFYERVINESASLGGKKVSVRLAEEISLESSAGGGKAHSLALHDYFEREASLKQHNSAGNRIIAFMLDRDLDDFTGAMRSTPHVIYTNGADIEAEILTNGDWERALSSSHGLAASHIEKIRLAVPDPVVHLASMWRDWVTLRLAASDCGKDSVVRFAGVSKVNVGTYGAVNRVDFDAISNQITALVGAEVWEQSMERASTHFDSARARNEDARLVKGKWVSSYMLHLVHTHLADEIVIANVRADAVVSVCIETLKYDQPWLDYYDTRFIGLLAA